MVSPTTTSCQWLPYLNRCRCGWKPSNELPLGLPIMSATFGLMVDTPRKKEAIESHLDRPVNKNEIVETKVSVLL